MRILCVLLGLVVLTNGDYRRKKRNPLTCDQECARQAGEPKILDSFFTGKLHDRSEYEVNGIGNYPSYAGFSLVDANTENSMFWWYFPAQNGDKEAPLVLWLQGGPGGSSLFGLFAEMGPLDLKSPTGPAVEREFHWNKEYAMIFIDNPVGAGFSFTNFDAGYATNTRVDVAEDLYVCLQEFYLLFPELQKNDFYITGESYGGHYVPAFGAYIHQMNADGRFTRVNLQGVAIGDGWIDPVNQMQGYPELMYNMGFASNAEKVVIQNYVDQSVKAVEEGRMMDAFNIWDEMLNGDIYPYPNYFHNITGSNDYDNMLNINAPESFDYFSTYVDQPEIRRAIHVGNATFNSGLQAEMHLREDVQESYKPELTILIENNYKVLLYSGQLDVIIGAALTERFLPTIKWPGAEGFANSKKILWQVDNEVAGYANTYENFSYVIVRNGGHILPADQPKPCLDMINRFIKGVPFSDEKEEL